MQVRAMQESDYGGVYKLWCNIKGFGIRSIDDSKENIERFLDRNPNLNAVAVIDQEIVGSILCGCDDHTGGFYHVCVHKDRRKEGIAHGMTKFRPEALKSRKISEIALIVFKDNDLGSEFWGRCGFTLRKDVDYHDSSLNPHNQTSFNVWG